MSDRHCFVPNGTGRSRSGVYHEAYVDLVFEYSVLPQALMVSI